MTVKQLKEQLAKYPDNMQVFVADRKTEFKYGLVNSIYQKKITFHEEWDSKPLATDEVLIIDEE
jgi:hypothetical protein